MAVTVQELVTRLHRRIDPLTDENVEITTSTVGTVDGQSFPKQRILDVYNEARKSLAASFRLVVPTWFSTREVSGCLVRIENLQFAEGSATKPDGYIYPERLTDGDGGKIVIMGLDRVGAVKDFESATKRYVLDIGNNFVAESGKQFVTNASNYILWYFGVKDWALSDVTGGTSVETYNEIWHNHLLEIANAIANEVGQDQISLMTIKFFMTVRAQLGAANA
jgi:hypothetical protein